MIRQPASQSLHDSIIRIAAENLTKTAKYKVYTNPDGEHNTSLGNSYPDIILTPIGNNTVQFIVEVETADSINESEVSQWREYSAIGGTFYLLVPKEELSRTKQICALFSITAKFGYFSVENGNAIITYE